MSEGAPQRKRDKLFSLGMAGANAAAAAATAAASTAAGVIGGGGGKKAADPDSSPKSGKQTLGEPSAGHPSHLPG